VKDEPMRGVRRRDGRPRRLPSVSDGPCRRHGAGASSGPAGAPSRTPCDERSQRRSPLDDLRELEVRKAALTLRGDIALVQAIIDDRRDRLSTLQDPSFQRLVARAPEVISMYERYAPPELRAELRTIREALVGRPGEFRP
jgi:hypothetical protein